MKALHKNQELEISLIFSLLQVLKIHDVLQANILNQLDLSHQKDLKFLNFYVIEYLVQLQ